MNVTYKALLFLVGHSELLWVVDLCLLVYSSRDSLEGEQISLKQSLQIISCRSLWNQTISYSFCKNISHKPQIL